MTYPTIDPAPTIDWGPGGLKASTRSEWEPADAAVQVQEHDCGECPTIAQLALYTTRVAAEDREELAAATSVELTAYDCIMLADRLIELAAPHLQLVDPNSEEVPTT